MTTDNVEHGSSSSSHDQHLQHTVDDAHRQAARDEDVARLRENLAALHSYVAGMHGDIAALLEQHQKTITEQVALHARLKEAEAKGRALRQELETASQQIAIFKEPKLILGPEGGHSDRGARGVGLGSAAPPQSTSTVEEHNMLVAELHATLLARDSMINALRMELSRQHSSMANLHQTLADLLRQHQATVTVQVQMTLQLQQAYAKIEEMRRRAEVVASGGDDSGESTAITTPQMEVRQGPSSAPKEEVDERRERDSSVEQLSIGSSETDF